MDAKEHYVAEATCRNCGWEGQAVFSCGKLVRERTCPNCRCFRQLVSMATLELGESHGMTATEVEQAESSLN